MILSPTQLRELTGRVRRSAQRSTLDHLRIPYRLRPDGSIVVFEADLHATTENRPPHHRVRIPPARRVFPRQATIAPKVFHVPGLPAVVQTQPMFPEAAGAVFSATSPTFHDPVVGATLPNTFTVSPKFWNVTIG